MMMIHNNKRETRLRWQTRKFHNEQGHWATFILSSLVDYVLQGKAQPPAIRSRESSASERTVHGEGKGGWFRWGHPAKVQRMAEQGGKLWETSHGKGTERPRIGLP